MIKIHHFIIISVLVISNAFALPNSGVPALCIVSPNGQSSIMIGSVHVGIEGLREPDSSVLAHANRIVIEHHGVRQPGDEGAAPGKDRAAWAKNLTSEEIAVYLQRTSCAHVAKADALAYLSRPSNQWANQIAYTICDGPNVQSRDSMLATASSRGMPVETLEEDAWVETKRRTVPAHVGDAGFKWTLSHDPKTVLIGIRDALNNGDYKSVRRQFDASIGNAADAATMDRIMVDERNAAWMPKLRKYLDNGHALILVGAMHLPGPKGLISLLQSSGYTVRMITLSESRPGTDQFWKSPADCVN